MRITHVSAINAERTAIQLYWLNLAQPTNPQIQTRAMKVKFLIPYYFRTQIRT